MSLRSRVRTWSRAVFRAGELSRQVSEELAFHIESYAADLMRNGLAREEALRRARMEIGSIAARKENCREARGTRMVDDLRVDLRLALRTLKASPGFTVVAAMALLGIVAAWIPAMRALRADPLILLREE